jgi:alpha-tubulin suppressor-like RCC1 family protein
MTSRLSRSLRGVLAIAVAALLAANQTSGAVQGSLAAWGDNSSGQSTVPPDALSGVVGVTAGDAHSLALKEDGTVVAWGGNLSGQGMVPASLSGISAIAAGGYHNLALRTDGTVVAWGYNGQGQSAVPAGLNAVVAIAAGGFHSLALKQDGTVVAWGYNYWGQSTVPTNLSGVVAIAAGYYYSLALRIDGTVVAWGRSVSGEGATPASLGGIVAIAAGRFHNLALKSDGTVVAWGRNNYGESTVPAGLNGVLAIAAGSFHSLALKSGGTLVAWGNNDCGQSTVPDEVSGAVVIAAGAYHNLVGLRDRAPFLFRQPTNQTVAVGASALFVVGAGGTGPLHYQWRKDDMILIGETNSSLTMHGVQILNTGAYSVVVTNSVGSVTSQLARLTVGYSLVVQTSGSGTVLVAPNQNLYEPNTPVTLTAGAAVNNQFISWSGDASGNQNPLVLTMDAHKTVTATFRPGYRVTVAAEGPGSVTITPLKSYYLQGDVVQIAATPALWHHFARWSDGVTTNPRSVTVNSGATFTAVFVLTSPLEKVEFGGVSRVAPVGMPAVFVDGVFAVRPTVSARGSATVSLLTTFSRGSLLFTTDGSDPDFSSSLYVSAIGIEESATLRAIAYNADFTQSVEADPLEIIILPTLNTGTEGGGTVAIDPPAGAYFSNDLAVVTAAPAPGWRFLHWLGDETGTNPAATVSMSRNKCVQAVFGAALGNTVVGSGGVVRSPAADLYPYGTQVRLAAVPQAGSYFALWGNAATGTNNPLTFPVTNPNPTVTAVFATLPANQHALTVVPDGFGTVTNSPRGNRFGNGTNVTLRALPEPGQEFLGWSGDASGTSNPLVVTMTQSRVITANFTKRPRFAPILCDGVPNGEELQLLLTGEFGGRYSIEATTNLAPAPPVWEPLATLTNMFGSVQFNDSLPTNRPRRFYRAAGP